MDARVGRTISDWHELSTDTAIYINAHSHIGATRTVDVRMSHHKPLKYLFTLNQAPMYLDIEQVIPSFAFSTYVILVLLNGSQFDARFPD